MEYSGDSAQLPARRRADLAQFVNDRGGATVAELATAFGVSMDTVRRDLEYLADQGVLARTHGGAVPAGRLATADRPFVNRMNVRNEAKEIIAKAAAALISDHETVLLNGGTTTLAVARALDGKRELTLVTNNLRVPAEAPQNALQSLYLLGGNVRIRSMVTVGPVGFPGTHGISADVAVIGVGGLSPSGGLSTSDLAEAQMMREMIDSAGRVIVVADASKFGRNAFAHIGPLSVASVLVTDDKPPPELAEALDAAQVEVITPGG